MSKRFRILMSIPAILVSCGIFYISHQTNPHMPDLGFDFGDKILHAFAYFVYGISLIMFLRANFRKISRNQIFLTVLIFGILFGLSDEYHQSFIPGRMAGIDDWIADTVGIMISLLLINPIKRASGTNN